MCINRFLLIFICSCLFSVANGQTALTAAQKNFQDELMTFLREEGFSPTFDRSDNSVNFKREGALHWIFISEEHPFFVSFCRGGFTMEGENGYKLLASLYACNRVNAERKAVKMYCDDKTVMIRVEQYTRSIEDFKYVFYKNLSTLAASHALFMKAYYETPDDIPK